MRIRAICPAKINPFLAVGSPHANGYHPIRTIFQAIDLAEWIDVSVSQEPGFVCNDPSVPAHNTVTKALRLAREYFEVPPLRIVLTKSGWTQGGLGLGSSNAAGLLRILMTLSRGQFELENALEVAAAVGADVSFFLIGGTARGENYGERLTPLPDSETEHCVIAKPSLGVNTALAYQALDSVSRPFSMFPTEGLGWQNDFESVMPKECLVLVEQMKQLGATRAHLCGSGSSVFGLFADFEEAQSVAKEIAKNKSIQAVPSKFLSRCDSLIQEVEP